MKTSRILLVTALATTLLASGCATRVRAAGHATGPLVIQAQGSFAVGGAVRRTPGDYDNNKPTSVGQSFHGDHLYAFYQVPQNAKATPIVMLHGAF